MVTVELRKLIAQSFNPFGDYPIFNETYRKTLETKIINHYYFREIGQETPARFKHYVTSKMNEIMPYYNKLYESELKLFEETDPFESYNLTETLTRNTQNSSKVNGSNTSKLLSLLSDTPQGSVDVNSNDYVSNINKNTSDDTTVQVADGQGTETYILTKKGNIGVQTLGYEMNEFRKAFLRIDEMVIDELKECFLMYYC